MTGARVTVLILCLAIATGAALVTFEGAREAAARYAILTWLVLAILVGLGTWATLRLPRSPRRSSTPPGVQWFPTGTWWGHRRDRRGPSDRRD